jgi:hypothetical protein
MAVSVVAHYPELSAETYDEVVASLDLDANPPPGAILHVAGESPRGITTSDIWQTEQTFRSYLDYRLRPALRMHGVHGEPVVEVAPLHNVYAPEMFTIERMGSVSLPANAAAGRL